MSKADQLGAGRFGGSGNSVSARRAAIAAATGVPTDGVAPPTKLPPHRISLNPDNPREALGDLTDLAGSLRDHGQKTAVTVMNRDAYARAHPTKAAELEDDTTHVVVDGSRRLAAAREAGLAEVKVMVDDEQGDDENQLLESALVANVHRADMEPLDEARALKRLLDIHGSQRALAKRLHRSQGWVSQRLALLGLTPELTQALEQGAESVDLLRSVGNKPQQEQRQALDELKQAQAVRTRQKKQAPQPRSGKVPDAGPPSDSQAPSDYAVITPGPPSSASAPEGKPADAGQEEPQVPEPRSVPEQVIPAGRPLPYDDGVTVGQHLAVKMGEDAFLKAAMTITGRCWDKVGLEASFEVLRAMLGAAGQRNPDMLLPILKEALATYPADAP